MIREIGRHSRWGVGEQWKSRDVGVQMKSGEKKLKVEAVKFVRKYVITDKSRAIVVPVNTSAVLTDAHKCLNPSMK